VSGPRGDSRRRVEMPTLVRATVALAAGFAIAWMDTRPHWDDTGVTAGALLLSAALASMWGIRPWLSTILVVAPLVAFEISGGAKILIAVLFPLIGAYIGWRIRGRM
jgi:hypothetical protein